MIIRNVELKEGSLILYFDLDIYVTCSGFYNKDFEGALRANVIDLIGCRYLSFYVNGLHQKALEYKTPKAEYKHLAGIKISN